MIRLDIFSDPTCPWCYIGKAALDRALESRPEHPFVIRWHPFRLNPDLPPEGMAMADFLDLRFRDRSGAMAALTQAQEAAQANGLSLALDQISQMPNVTDALRLIHWAEIEGKQNAVVDGLFRAHFREGRNIATHAVLCEIAEAAGMEPQAVARLLQSDADRDDLLARDEDARAKGVSMVPTYLIAQHYVLSGAQTVSLWQQVIDEICAADGAAGSSSGEPEL